jgi:hypothetical protein
VPSTTSPIHSRVGFLLLVSCEPRFFVILSHLSERKGRVSN